MELRSKTPRSATGSTEGRCTAGCCAMRPKVWLPWPTAAPSPIAACTRWCRRSRRASSSYEDPSPGGALARSSTNSAESSRFHRLALRSTAASCAIASSNSSLAAADATTTKRWERSRAIELWQLDVLGNVKLATGITVSVVTGIDDHSRFCVIAKVVSRATARPVCEALLETLNIHGIPEQILTDNGKVFTGRLGKRPAHVLFDRICLNNGIRHLLTAPYSPTTTGKVERLHKTMRKEFFSVNSFHSIVEMQAALDIWVVDYNHNREHQSLGDVPPIRRFELARPPSLEVIDGDVAPEQEPTPRPKTVTRRVDRAGRISILKHRYHVGRQLAGESVTIESADGLLHISHNGVVVATHARRHLIDDDDRMDRRAKVTRPENPTKGAEVLRIVDPSGGVSFAGTSYRVGNRFRRQTVGVRLVGDTVQITLDGALLRTHRARHDRSKEFGALAQPNGKPRKARDGGT
jgi:transposase InsO family protein